MDRNPQNSFQDMILALHDFWSAQGCLILQPYDMRMGAGTFHTATTLRALGPEPWNAAFVQPCRRPTDGRYGENPNRLQHYYQYQVILKPSPPDIQDLYLKSLEVIGIDPLKHDIRFVEDDWESPTLGAWGLGWEVWCDGMEVTQFTYFQQMGGFDCKPVAGELTYGLERLAMYIQGVDNVYDLNFNGGTSSSSEAVGRERLVSYGDVFLENEKQMSKWNFEVAETDALFELFNKAEAECKNALANDVPIAAYEQAVEAERQRIAAQAAQAREAGVMMQSSGRAGSAVVGAIADAAASAQPTVEPAQTDRLALNPDSDPNNQQRKLDFIGQSASGGIANAYALQAPASPYQVIAGSVIAASLLTGLNSDLPGMVVAQVTENVFDTVTGRTLLIPQGSRLIGSYDSVVAFG